MLEPMPCPTNSRTTPCSVSAYFCIRRATWLHFRPGRHFLSRSPGSVPSLRTSADVVFHITNEDGVCGVAAPTVHFHSAVNADDVAVLDLPLARDAVDDFFVHGDAERCGEARSGLIRRVPLKEARRPAFIYDPLCLVVEFAGGDAVQRPATRLCTLRTTLLAARIFSICSGVFSLTISLSPNSAGQSEPRIVPKARRPLNFYFNHASAGSARRRRPRHRRGSLCSSASTAVHQSAAQSPASR